MDAGSFYSLCTMLSARETERRLVSRRCYHNRPSVTAKLIFVFLLLSSTVYNVRPNAFKLCPFTEIDDKSCEKKLDVLLMPLHRG